MATKRTRARVGYGLSDALPDLAPLPIVANRAPTANDTAEIGTNWVDTTSDAVYTITSIVAGAANWATAPSSGATTLASLIVTTTSDLQGNTTIGGTLDVTGLTTVADLTATGTTTINGDLDLSSAALIDLTSTLDAAPSIYLHANGGTSEQILLRSDLGTSATSISLLSDVGGIALTATGSTSASAISLAANAGGVAIAGAGVVDISSSANGASAVVVESTVGGVDILASGAAAGEDINIVATGSSVNINSTEDVANSIVISSTNGGIDITASGTDATDDIDINSAMSLLLSADEASANAINIEATDAAGGILLTSGTGGHTISSVGGSLTVEASEDAADAVYLHANGGTSETIRLHADQGTGVASVALVSDVGGITLSSGLASADAINLAASAGGVDIDGALQVNIASSQNAVDAVVINASAGGIDILAAGAATEDIDIVNTAGSVNITGGEAAADAVTIQSSNAAGGIDISAGTGGLDLDSTGAISLDAAAASNFTTTGAGIDINMQSTAGRVIVTAGEDAADAIYLHADAGTSEKIRVHSDQGTGLDSVSLVSDAGGVSVSTAALAATTGLHLVQGAATAAIQVGAGVPSHNAPKGSLYLNTTGSSTSTRAYIATDAVGNWTAITTAS